MRVGCVPAVIAVPGVPVARSTGVIVPSLLLAT